MVVAVDCCREELGQGTLKFETLRAWRVGVGYRGACAVNVEPTFCNSLIPVSSRYDDVGLAIEKAASFESLDGVECGMGLVVA